MSAPQPQAGQAPTFPAKIHRVNGGVLLMDSATKEFIRIDATMVEELCERYNQHAALQARAALADQLAAALADLTGLAECAMKDANNDGAEHARCGSQGAARGPETHPLHTRPPDDWRQRRDEKRRQHRQAISVLCHMHTNPLP